MPFPRRKREVEPDTSEAMRALPSDRWRSFVTFYLLEAPQRGAQTNACKRAGFGNPNSPQATFQKVANRLMSDPRIQRAILEEARKMLRGAAPEAVNALLNVIRDPKHRDHIRGVDMLLSRTDAVETHSTITHHIEVDHHREALDQLALMKRLGLAREKLEEMFGYSGLSRYERLLEEREGGKRSQDSVAAAAPDPRVIEGKAVEVKPSGERW